MHSCGAQDRRETDQPAGNGADREHEQVLSGMLFGVSPFDPVTLAAVVVLVILAATCAAVVPAARAARIHPMRTLREE